MLDVSRAGLLGGLLSALAVPQEPVASLQTEEFSPAVTSSLEEFSPFFVESWLVEFCKLPNVEFKQYGNVVSASLSLSSLQVVDGQGAEAPKILLYLMDFKESSPSDASRLSLLLMFAGGNYEFSLSPKLKPLYEYMQDRAKGSEDIKMPVCDPSPELSPRDFTEIYRVESAGEGKESLKSALQYAEAKYLQQRESAFYLAARFFVKYQAEIERYADTCTRSNGEQLKEVLLELSPGFFVAATKRLLMGQETKGGNVFWEVRFVFGDYPRDPSGKTFSSAESNTSSSISWLKGRPAEELFKMLLE